MKRKHLSKETILKYYTNALTPQEEDQVQEHLLNCDKCSKKIDELRYLHQELYREETAPKFKFRRVHFLTITAAAACIILLVGIVQFISNSGPDGVDLHKINHGRHENPVFSTDTFPQKDTTRIEIHNISSIDTELINEKMTLIR